MPPQLRLPVRLSLPKTFKTRWSTRSGRRGPALVSPASVGGDPRRIEGDADDERNYYQGNHAGDHMDMEIEAISRVESLESSVSWNNHAPTVASSFPSVVTIENDIETESEVEVTRRAEETFDSTTASIATIVSTEDELTVDSEIGNAALEVVSKLNAERDFVSAAPQPIHNVGGDVPAPHADYRKVIANHVVEKGDRVRVIRKGEKYGMSGIIARTTKAFVFFEDERTGTRVQIMPKFVELVVVDSTTTLSQDRGGVTRQQQQQQQQPLAGISPPSFDTKRDTPQQAPNDGRQRKQRNNVSPPSQKPTDFPKLSTVLVDKCNRKHGGKVGIVEGHTDCFVQIKFKPKKVDRVKPKFLTLIAGDNQSISSSKSSEPTSSKITDGDGTPQNDTDSVVERGGYAAEQFEQFKFDKFIVGKMTFIKSSTPAACAFESIWERDICLPPLEIPLTELPLKRCDANGKKYELYYFRIGEDMSDSLLFKKKKNVTAYYVNSEILREHEELLADFGALPAHKVLARRALLFSPAMKIGNKYAITRIPANDVTLVDDLGTAGCGFISETVLEDLLGNNIKARTALGVQVRIFVPTMGIFKGVLMRKRNMQTSIELNDSLLKVGPSRDPNASDIGWIVITKAFPSIGNYTFSRVFKIIEEHLKQKSLPKSFKREVQKERSFKMSPMYSQVMESLGVPNAVIESYRSDYHKNPEKIQHTHLVGVADPTSQLPPNTVFVTGIEGVEIDKLFVTRSPCMERKDGRVLRVVTTKPDSMKNDEWEWLQNLSFGALVFANPKPGDRPLPELIADGDLDGDLYFVCWQKTILTNLNSIPITDDELVAPLDAHTKSKDYDHEWFDKTQRFIAEAPMYHAGIDALVGILHNKWKKIGDINDANAISFSRASKYALDLKTHGGLIFLPKHLWDQVPGQLHHYLTTDEK